MGSFSACQKSILSLILAATRLSQKWSVAAKKVTITRRDKKILTEKRREPTPEKKGGRLDFIASAAENSPKPTRKKIRIGSVTRRTGEGRKVRRRVQRKGGGLRRTVARSKDKKMKKTPGERRKSNSE